jgi:monofunctional biosynthetic peptidoglycan transglycosylase
MSAASSKGRTGWRRILRHVMRRALWAALALLLVPVPVILLLAVVQPPMTSVMVQQTIGRAFTGTRPLWPKHTPVARSAISGNLRRAVLASEDDRFYLHHGIDFVEMNNALERRRRAPKRADARAYARVYARVYASVVVAIGVRSR